MTNCGPSLESERFAPESVSRHAEKSEHFFLELYLYLASSCWLNLDYLERSSCYLDTWVSKLQETESSLWLYAHFHNSIPIQSETSKSGDLSSFYIFDISFTLATCCLTKAVTKMDRYIVIQKFSQNFSFCITLWPKYYKYGKISGADSFHNIRPHR